VGTHGSVLPSMVRAPSHYQVRTDHQLPGHVGLGGGCDSPWQTERSDDEPSARVPAADCRLISFGVEDPHAVPAKIGRAASGSPHSGDTAACAPRCSPRQADGTWNGARWLAAGPSARTAG